MLQIEEFFGLKAKMYSFLVGDNNEHQKSKGVNEILSQQYDITNMKMFCWVVNIGDIQWIEFKLKTI